MQHSLKRTIAALAAALAAMLAVQSASAQYYSWGADPARFRWMREADSLSDVIYPRHASEIGASTAYFVRRMHPYISYGYRMPALDLPFIVHPENMRSNGLVMWLPKRVEFLSTPAIDGYSMPWIKQLVAHEYRHAVQYNNLNVGVVKAVSYLLGEQSSTIGLLFMPLWMIEGDATMSETETSSFGRALQPRFTLEFRAMGDIATKYRNTDKFLCGSYRDFIPDHYQLGYQMVAHGNQLAGRIICDEIAAYGPRHPWMVVSTGLTMKKLFGFTTLDLFRSTFRSLTDYWATLPAVDPTTEPLPAPAVTSYTTYSDPIWIGKERLLLTKEDLDRTSHFVTLDTSTGEEQTLCYTGDISTRPAYDAAARRLWWTEYRRSAMFDEKVDSRLCYLDLDTLGTRTALRPRTMRGADAPRGNILYPTPDQRGGLAWVDYRADGIYTIHHRTSDGTHLRRSMPFGEEIHSLAWDNATQRLYYIATGNDGMWIGSLDGNFSPQQITRPAYITLSNLRARDGKLYFGSIASGRDEAHCYDLASGREYQITESLYGSFDPAPSEDGRLAVTTYDSTGYHPALQRTGSKGREVAYSPLPRNLVNPPRERWGTINLDTVRLDSTSAARAAVEQRPYTRRYRKGGALFNFHSWAPLSYDPFSLSEEGAINMNLGATVMTQNLLSSAQGFFTYGWNSSQGSVWKGSMRYHGLGPTISLNATYGGHQNIYPVYVYNSETHKIEFPVPPAQGRYYSIGTDISLPFMLDCGHHIRYIVASASWSYSNGLVADTGRLNIGEGGISNIATIGYKKGIHLTAFSLGYQDMTRLSHRDFATPWGFVASATYAMNPANRGFDDLVSFYAKLYTPGLLPHNSLTVAAAYQNSFGGFSSKDALSALTFNATKLLPRGFYSTQIENRHYVAASLNYQLPIWYPDGGLRGIIYFKRIRANVGFDYAQFRRVGIYADGLRERWHRINSWGGDLTFDVNLLSQPASATVGLTLSLYIPSEGGAYFSAGMALPF